MHREQKPHDRALAARAIRAARERASLTQGELGARCDPPAGKMSISRAERLGAARRTLVTIATALGTTADDLLAAQLEAERQPGSARDEPEGPSPASPGATPRGVSPARYEMLRQLIYQHHGVIAHVAAELQVTRQAAAEQIQRAALAGDLAKARGGAQLPQSDSE